LITNLKIQGFKRFVDQSFELKPLTVLTGLNGSGKTSLIHSILLSQEAEKCKPEGNVQLNGPYGLELGTVGDILNWNIGDTLGFEIAYGENSSCFDFDWMSEESMYLSLSSKSKSCNTSEHARIGSFTYLSAERHGPRLNHLGCSLPDEELEVGYKGQNCAQILEARGSKPLALDRLHPDSEAPSFLKYEVEKWLSEIARPVEIEAERYPGSTVYSLKYRTIGGLWVNATNMGFGVSYSLPIILAGLTATKGGVILVENPEAHLHPLGQSKMGSFLAWVAAQGVQVVVETHSDHIINGIRLGIGESKYLTADSAIIHFFESDEIINVQALRFTSVGGVDSWPDGFFDQYQIDTAALGKLRRRG